MQSKISTPVFALLVLSVWINYIDRGTLGVAAPTLAPELQLSATQMGYLLSAFFWTYSICLFISGWMVDRVNVVRFYAAGFLV
jgi:sugar phosphate permease